MVDKKQVCEHEIGHGIVALCLGFDNFTRIFVDFATPGINRRGGIDIQIEGLREKFDSAIPQLERRSLAVRVIAVFAAGKETENLLGKTPDENWSEWDEDQIQWFGLAAVWADEDMELLEKSVSRNNGWGKWADVDAVIAEGRALALEHLKKNAQAIGNASTLLHVSVQSMRGKGYITRGQLSQIMQRQRSSNTID